MRVHVRPDYQRRDNFYLYAVDEYDRRGKWKGGGAGMTKDEAVKMARRIRRLLRRNDRGRA